MSTTTENTAPSEQVFELEPVPTVMAGMPDPGQFKATLLEAVNQGYQLVTADRTAVVSAEDTYDVQRRLAGSLEKCKAYREAFTAAETLLKQYQEEELISAVGEQDGIPVGPLTVPDAHGDISITLDQKHTYDIDVDTLVSAIAATVQEGWNYEEAHSHHDKGATLAEFITAVVEGDSTTPPAELENLLATALMAAQFKLTECGKFSPQVTKVRAYAAEVARTGADGLSAMVAGAVVKTTEYKGLKTNRKAPK